jgi:hypothetical protein
MRRSERAISILYVAGAGRSGSTVLGDALALALGVRHVGELRGVFDYTDEASGLMHCSCGRRYLDCLYWASAFRAAWGDGWRQVLESAYIEGELPRSVQVALSHLVPGGPNAVATRISAPLRLAMARLRQLLAVLCEQDDCRVIVDSSKSGVFAWLLSREPGVRIAAVHLVRDPRAVAHSWTTKPIPLPAVGRKRLMILRTRPARDALSYWARANVGALLLRLYGIPYCRVRYEDFVVDPVTTVETVARFARSCGMPVELDSEAMKVLRMRMVLIRDRHLIGANPGVKAQRERIVLRDDLAWVREMPLIKRLVWTSLLLPILVCLGYPLWPRDTQHGREA